MRSGAGIPKAPYHKYLTSKGTRAILLMYLDMTDMNTPYPLTVAFDVDGTLVSYEDRPREEAIILLKSFKKLGAKVIVWSGGGKDYAESWVRRLFLEDYVDMALAKPSVKEAEALAIDVAVDDENVAYGKVQFKV